MAKKMRWRERGTGSFRVKDNGKLEYRFPYRNEYGEIKIKSATGDNEEMCMENAATFLEIQEKKNRGIDIDSTIPDIIKMIYKSDLKKTM